MNHSRNRTITLDKYSALMKNGSSVEQEEFYQREMDRFKSCAAEIASTPWPSPAYRDLFETGAALALLKLRSTAQDQKTARDFAFMTAQTASLNAGFASDNITAADQYLEAANAVAFDPLLSLSYKNDALICLLNAIDDAKHLHHRIDKSAIKKMLELYWEIHASIPKHERPKELTLDHAGYRDVKIAAVYLERYIMEKFGAEKPVIAAQRGAMAKKVMYV